MSSSTQIAQEIQQSLELQKAIVLYRLPEQKDFHLLIDEKPMKQQTFLDYNLAKGFSFFPFDLEDDYGYLIHDHKHHKIDLKTIDSTDFIKIKNFEKRTQFSENTTKSDYTDGVKEAVKEINNEGFRKVVLSRIRNKKYENNDSPFFHFFALTKAYPRAFISLVSIPELGTWINATPEILMNISEKKIFKTVALAGTQKSDIENLKEALWSQKEIEEQAFVSKYIISCFKKIRLREYDDIGPKTIRAGQLLHLKTDFLVNMIEVEKPDLATEMLPLLHPTSAVCGQPKKESLTFIKKTEKHKRHYFTGFCGPINIENETHQYVNLRCAEYLEDSIRFYAGAGLTEDSDPEKEWNETFFKTETLNSVLYASNL